jgi:hypothetical protein
MARCVRLVFLQVLLLFALVLPSPVGTAAFAVDIASCYGSGYLSVTSDRGTASPFTSARECQQFVKSGGTLYSVPTASWRESTHFDSDGEGGGITWCETNFPIRNLDPGKVYQAHLVVSSIPYPSMAYDRYFQVPINSKGAGTLTISWEECAATPISAYGELLDANGSILATDGPVLLFTLS